MTLTYLSKESAYMDINDSTRTYRCPYRTTKTNDLKPKEVRSVRVYLRAKGACQPKPPGKANLRQSVVLQIDIKDGRRRALLRDPNVDMETPCELENFRFEAFGLKGS